MSADATSWIDIPDRSVAACFMEGHLHYSFTAEISHLFCLIKLHLIRAYLIPSDLIFSHLVLSYFISFLSIPVTTSWTTLFCSLQPAIRSCTPSNQQSPLRTTTLIIVLVFIPSSFLISISHFLVTERYPLSATITRRPRTLTFQTGATHPRGV